MDREAWRAAIHGVAKSRTWLSNWTELNWYPLSIWPWQLDKLHVCVLSHVWLLAATWTVVSQGPLSMWLSRQEYWFSSIQSLSHVCLFATPWAAARQTSLSITNSQSLLKFISTESVLPSNHLSLSSPSPTFNISQHQGLFQWVSSSYQVAKALEFQLQHQSFQWIFRTDFL